MDTTQLSPVIEETLHHAGFEAAALGHELREPGHLLIGIVAMPNNVARTVLRDFGITIDMLRRSVAKKYPLFDEDQSFADLDSPATFDVLHKTEQIAQQDNDHLALARLDHLLIGLIETAPVVSVIFVDFGVGTRDVLRRLDHEIAG